MVLRSAKNIVIALGCHSRNLHLTKMDDSIYDKLDGGADSTLRRTGVRGLQ
jgi:hypothetical protein